MEQKIIVSLGRQFGSGGRQLGRRLAEMLGIAYYDRELMDEVARRSGMDVEYLKKQDEQAPGFFDYATFGHFGSGRLFGSGQSFVLLSQTIRQIAAAGSCLIVGRTADYILRDDPHLIRLFVHAPRRCRILTVAHRMGISADEAEALVTRHDKERARFYDFFTDKTWGEAASYDLSVDASCLGLEATAEMLRHYIEQRAARFAAPMGAHAGAAAR